MQDGDVIRKEEEGLISAVVDMRNVNRSSQGPAKLVIPDLGLGNDVPQRIDRSERVAGIRGAVLVELVDVAMNRLVPDFKTTLKTPPPV